MSTVTKHLQSHQRRPEARPQELLKAALDLFAEKGYSATRLEDVAIRAGVTKGTLYIYFENKAALFRAVVEDGIFPVLDKGEDIVANFAGGTSELLSYMTQTWWTLVGESKLSGICKIMVAEAANFPEMAAYFHNEVIVRGERLARKIIETGINTGEFRAIDIEVAVDSLFSPILKLMLWRHSFANYSQSALEPRAYIEKHLDIVLNGLMAGAKS